LEGFGSAIDKNFDKGKNVSRFQVVFDHSSCNGVCFVIIKKVREPFLSDTLLRSTTKNLECIVFKECIFLNMIISGIIHYFFSLSFLFFCFLSRLNKRHGKR